MVRVHVRFELLPHLHSFVLDGIEYINDCYKEVTDERKSA